MTLTHGRAIALMVAVTFLWGTAGVVTRHLDQVRGFEVTFWRSSFTLLSLLIILPLWRGLSVFRSVCQGGRTLWLSGLCWSIMFTAFMVALSLTSTANVLVTMAAGPLLTALAARVFIGHRLPARTWGAIVVAGLGIVWMYASQLGQGAWAGTLVALCVPIAGACNWTLVQHMQVHRRAPTQEISLNRAIPQDRAEPDGDMVPAVLLGALISALSVLPWAWPFRASAHDLGLLGFLGLMQLAVPCVLAVLCARVLKAPELALLALLELIFGIALAWLGADEVPQASVLVGGTLVITALVFNEWLGWRSRAQQAA